MDYELPLCRCDRGIDRGRRRSNGFRQVIGLHPERAKHHLRSVWRESECGTVRYDRDGNGAVGSQPTRQCGAAADIVNGRVGRGWGTHREQRRGWEHYGDGGPSSSRPDVYSDVH